MSPSDPAALFRSLASQVRRPLTGALALAELLERQGLPSGAQEHVRSIVEQNRALLRALDDAADLASASVGQLALAPRPVGLRALMDEVQARWQARAHEAGVALLVSYEGDEGEVMVDPARLAQVFDHLIDHALRLTRRGGVEAGLRVQAADGGVLVGGRVRDSGQGLTPERLARIFDPVAAGPDSEGVGLALSGRLVQAMSGAIRAESNPGAGLTVSFDFMVERAPTSPAVEQETAARSLHVLVVDDNATNRMVAEALCEMFDCTSESAEDGLEAVEIARSGRFDLILMDIKMPRMDGVSATRAIRALPGLAGRTPIIALTANADPEDAKAYIAAGMTSVVEKPIKPEALLAAMNASLLEGGQAGGRAAA